LRDTDSVAAVLAEAAALHQQVSAAGIQKVVDAANAVVAAFAQGGKLLTFGNGGSATDAQHLAAELVGRFERERRGLAAVALTNDMSVLTSVANDYSFDRVFARQVEALGRAGDVAFGISTSGNSRNVLAALEQARSAGLTTIALTGRDGGVVGKAVDIHINVASDSTPRVQEVHRTLLHALCELVERAIAE
jgi:phosphoheptose isomerase